MTQAAKRQCRLDGKTQRITRGEISALLSGIQENVSGNLKVIRCSITRSEQATSNDKTICGVISLRCSLDNTSFLRDFETTLDKTGKIRSLVIDGQEKIADRVKGYS